MSKNFCKTFIIIFLIISEFFAKNTFSATVSSISVSNPIGFGLINPNTGGTLKTSTGCATASGTAYSMGQSASSICANGSFFISGTNNRTGGNRNRIRVTIPASTTITFSGRTMNIALSLSSTANVTSQNFNLSGASNGPGNVTVPVYATITVGSNQFSGNYAGSFNFMACNNNLASC